MMKRYFRSLFFVSCLMLGGNISLADNYAFLVGVHNYDPAELTSLRYTESDVTVLAETLLDAGYPRENVIVLTQARGARNLRLLPLARTIRKELQVLLSGVKKDDTVIVGFSGHGVQFKSDKTGYFCPMDAQLSDKETLVALSDVYRWLDACPARRKLLLADACRDNPFPDVTKGATKGLILVNQSKLAPPPEGIAALFSCSTAQQSFEVSELEHGVFFHYLIQGLQGAADLDTDSSVDLFELQKYVTRNVPQYVREKLGRLQVPESHGTTRGSFIVLAVPKINVPPRLKPALRQAAVHALTAMRPTVESAEVAITKFKGENGQWMARATLKWVTAFTQKDRETVIDLWGTDDGKRAYLTRYELVEDNQSVPILNPTDATVYVRLDAD